MTSFALDLKVPLLCELSFGKVSPRFFTMKLVCFIGFLGLSYLVYVTILLCMIFIRLNLFNYFVGFIPYQILLVIQHLETLYLGGNHVRVVCERM